MSKRSTAFLPLGLLLLLVGAQPVYHEALPAAKALILAALAAAGAAGAAVTAREEGLLAATVFHVSALLCILAGALYQGLVARAAGILGGAAAPLAGALVAAVALDRARPSLALHVAAALLALAVAVAADHAAALLPALLALLLPLLLAGRVRSARRRALLAAGWGGLTLLLALPFAALVNRAVSFPMLELRSAGFLVVDDPLAGGAALPRVPELLALPAITGEVGAGRTWLPGASALLPGRRPFLPRALPGAVASCEALDGTVRPAFLPDALRLLPGAEGFPFSRRATLRLPLRRGALGLAFLAPPVATGETFAFPPKLVAASPARAFMRAGGGALHFLDEERGLEGEPSLLSLRAVDAGGRLLYARPLGFEPLDLAWAAGPVVAGRSADPVTFAETWFVEFRGRSGEVRHGFTFPDRIHALVPTLDPPGALVFHGARVTTVFRDGTAGGSVGRSSPGPVAALPRGRAGAVFLDYLDGTLHLLERDAGGTSRLLPVPAPRADFLALAGERLLLGDFAGSALHAGDLPAGPFRRLEAPRRGLRSLAAAPGGFLVADDAGLALLDPDGTERARAGGLRPAAPPEPFGDGFAATDGTRLLLLDDRLALRAALEGAAFTP